MCEEKEQLFGGDSQEQIDKCLNCWRAECINCLDKPKEIQDEQPSHTEEKKQSLEDTIIELHRAGLNDTQIARIVDKSSSWISNIRKKLGLPCNADNGRQFKFTDAKIDEALFYKLYNEGRSDRAISRTMNVPKCRVNSFRKKHGLPANYERKSRVKK